MRVLVVHPGSDFSVDDVHRGWVKGLRAVGCQVSEYNLNDRLAFYSNVRYGDRQLPHPEIVERAAIAVHSKLWEFWPDLVVVISGFYVLPITWTLLKYRDHHTALICTESPYEDERQMNLVAHAEPDVVIVNDPINLDRFRTIHKHVEYLPHCYDPDVHYPGHTRRDVDFAFVGTGYPSRIRLLDQVDWTGIDARIGGLWKGVADTSPLGPFLVGDRDECMENTAAADLYRRTKVSANLYRGGDPVEHDADGLAHGWAMGPREVELAACETFFLREPRGEGDLTFPMLPTFTGPDDFGDRLRWWLAHDTTRTAAARAACAISDRTFDTNARRLLELVDRT